MNQFICLGSSCCLYSTIESNKSTAFSDQNQILGSTAVGKSTLLESLKCGLFSSFFRGRLFSVGSLSAREKSKFLLFFVFVFLYFKLPPLHLNHLRKYLSFFFIPDRSRMLRQYSLPTPLCYSIGNPTYTKGIDVQQVTISGQYK